MLSGEISWSFFALAFAWSGAGGWPFPPSALYFILEQSGHQYCWSFMTGGPAALLMVTSLREWIAHERGEREDTFDRSDRCARVRGRLCLLGMFSWLYILYVLAPISGGANAITMVALGGVVFMWWFYKENRRVRREIRNQRRVGVLVAQGQG